MSVKIMRPEGLGNKKSMFKWQCDVISNSALSFSFFLPWFRSHVSSATPRCANGLPRTLHLLPLPQLPLAPHQVSRYASCVWTRLMSRAPAAVQQTNKRKATTEREGGNARRAGNHVSVTLKATTAATAPEALQASSSGTRGALFQPGAAPHREYTGTLAKSRISHQYRQSKNFDMNRKKMYEYIHGYI